MNHHQSGIQHLAELSDQAELLNSLIAKVPAIDENERNSQSAFPECRLTGCVLTHEPDTNECKALVAKNGSTGAQLRTSIGLGQMIGESPAFVSVLNRIPVLAKHEICALISGETGTGKEVFARAIHYNGRRTAKPFVPVNCGAIPADLLENEFFGHQPGAYTGASQLHRGLLKEADGGTLFLDEVDCLPLQAQVKLLRFIQDGQFRPLGCERQATADVRLIAASNTDLPEAIQSGRFRADLFYRLNVLALRLPPLRDREDDVVLLANHFLAACRNRFGEKKVLSPAALQKLLCYKWPGNVRELENVVQRAFILAPHTTIEPDDISVGPTDGSLAEAGFQATKARFVEEFERAYLCRVLRIHGGNITKAARSAGKNRRAFWELMRKHQIVNRSKPLPSVSVPRQNGSAAGQTCDMEKFSEKQSQSEFGLRPTG